MQNWRTDDTTLESAGELLEKKVAELNTPQPHPVKVPDHIQPHLSTPQSQLPEHNPATLSSTSTATPPCPRSDQALLATLQQKAATTKAAHAATTEQELTRIAALHPELTTAQIADLALDCPGLASPELASALLAHPELKTSPHPSLTFTTTSPDQLPAGSEQFLAESATPLTELSTRRSASERMLEREAERQHDMELEPHRRLRRIFIGACASLVLLGGIGGIIATVAAVNASKINYRSTYKSARELKTPIVLVRNNYACNDVINYVDNVYTTQQDYLSYADECLAIGEEALDAINQFTNTEGYLKDSEIQEQFDIFKDSFDQTVLTGSEVEKTLDLYLTWHKWLIAARTVDNWDQTEADLKKTAQILQSSGNQTLTKYAESWLKFRLAAAEAYRNYYDASYLAENRTELREAMESTQQTFNEWDAANQPNIQSVASLEVTGTAKLYSKFNHLYDLVKERYQDNYVSGSGDCAESISQIVCD